jgi:hypothetical protein
MANLLKHVDILDLVTINIFKGPVSKEDPNPLVVSIDPLDRSQRVVFDDGALKVMNEKLTEKLADKDARDSNTIEYLKEFVGRFVSELYRNGLCLIEDIPEGNADPYAEAKKLFRKN